MSTDISPFSSPSALYAGVADKEAGVVVRNTSAYPWEQVDTASASNVAHVCSDGVQVYAASGSKLCAYDDALTPKWVKSLTVDAIATDGHGVAVASGSLVSVRSCSSGGIDAAAVNHGADVHAVAIADGLVAIAGASGTGGKTVRLHNYSSGSLVEQWSVSTADAIGVSIACGVVYVAHDDDSGAFGRAIEIATGTTLWSYVSGGDDALDVAADNGGCVMVTTDTGAEVKRYGGLPAGGPMWEASVTNAMSVSVDDRYAHVITSGGLTHTLCRHTGALVGVIGTGDDADAYSDGERVYVARGGTTDELAAHMLPPSGRVWMRADSWESKPCQQLVFPVAW